MPLEQIQKLGVKRSREGEVIISKSYSINGKSEVILTSDQEILLWRQKVRIEDHLEEQRLLRLEGFAKGYAEGYAEGYARGYKEGYAKGEFLGRLKEEIGTVKTLIEYGISPKVDEEDLPLLCKKSGDRIGDVFKYIEEHLDDSNTDIYDRLWPTSEAIDEVEQEVAALGQEGGIAADQT